MSDEEIAEARAALRDASIWGAAFYKPEMYATAQTAFDAAVAARERDPDRCRSLLAEATAAASAAKAASLQAYQEDVKSRFATSRAKLLEIGADRAFPDEYVRLVSGIEVTDGLFAARSYWGARLEAYRTLTGMSSLYQRVHSLLDWLRNAQVRVHAQIEDARTLGASVWAPAEMSTAEQKYHDALAQMQAGDLEAAADSLKAAGLIAVRLPLLRGQMDKRAESAPMAAPPAGSEENKEVQSSNVRFQPPAARDLLAGQQVRIAQMSLGSLGPPKKGYLAVSAAVARFDVVAADGLRNAGIMEKVLAGLDDGWQAAVSRSGYFGFIYRDRIQMVKDLGIYPAKGEFLRAPYAAQFKLAGTRFRVNLVLCHIEPPKDRKMRDAEIAGLADVHRYFEKLTGNRGITLLLAGGLGELPVQASESLMPEMVPLLANPTGADGSDGRGQRIFASPALRLMIEQSGSGGSTPPVTYITLGAAR